MGEGDGGTGEEVNEGGWEVCARNRRQAGQPIPLDCIFFSACRGRVILYVCVCAWLCWCALQSISTVWSVVVVDCGVGVVDFACFYLRFAHELLLLLLVWCILCAFVCVCVYINWQCG